MGDNTPNNTGVSNPPNGGQVSDIANPEANDATVPQAAVATQETPQQSPAQDAASKAPQTPTPQAPQQAQAPGQPQDQGNNGGKQPDLSKTGNQPERLSGPVAPQNPAVAKAGMFHDIAETLAGGPRYKYDVDAYGNTTRQKVPVSNQHLALAIAMEALTGGITGAANGQGPNGVAKAAAAAAAQGEQKVQQQDEQAKKQAQEDFSHRAQVTETNMRLYANARNIGRMDAEDTDKYLAQYKPLIDQINKQYPGMSLGIVKYADLGKYNATSDTAIPYARVPRLANGQQVNDARGVPQWDMDYMILDPKFKASFEPTDQDRKNYKEMTGQDLPPATGNTAMNAILWMNKKSQLAGWDVAKTNFHDFQDTLNEAHQKQGGATAQADLKTDGTLKNTEIPDEHISGIVDDAANKVAGQVQTVIAPKNFNALFRGIIHNESSGNPNAVSPTGATGLGQLTQATAKQFGVTDRTDPVQNANASAQYFAQLLNQYKDPKLALAAYYSGPGAIQNGHIIDTQMHTAAATNNYAQSIANNVGLETVAPVKEGDQFKLPDIGAFSQANPSFPSAVEKFNASLGHTDGSYGAALKDMESKGFASDSALVQKYLGSANNIKDHDDFVQTQTEQRKADVQTAAQDTRNKNKTAEKEAEDAATQQRKQKILGTLDTADMPQDALNMAPKDLISNLQKQGVEVNPEVIRDAQAIARYEAPMSTASNKTWYKDAALNQQDMLSVVRQFNPAFNEGNYDNLKKMGGPNSPTMKTITASAGAANHLNMLLDAAQEMKTGGTGAGQFPMLNRLANEFNYHVGKPDYATLSALTNAVNGELGKVLSGGFAPSKEETDALLKTMTPQNSFDQIQALANKYIGVMHGKVLPIEEEYNQGSDGALHMKMIPNTMNTLFRRLGYSTPWDTAHQKQMEQIQQQQPQLQQMGFTGISNDGKFVKSVQGGWVPNPLLHQQPAQPQNSQSRAENLVQSLKQ